MGCYLEHCLSLSNLHPPLGDPSSVVTLDQHVTDFINGVSKKCTWTGKRFKTNKNIFKRNQLTKQESQWQANSMLCWWKLAVPYGAILVTLIYARPSPETSSWIDEVNGNGTRILPVLNDKVLDVIVTLVLGECTGMDHVDGRLIVAMEDRQSLGWEAKMLHDCA